MPPPPKFGDVPGVALFPLTVLFVIVRLPLLRMPPAVPPFPFVIARLSTETVFPTSTVNTGPASCPSSVAPSDPRSVRLWAMSKVPLQVP
jgi:hypothetical protein